jgi:DhnA family fructose-bisphosphate aldolase class Ia
MFFNYDSFEIVAIAFIVSGIFIKSFYNSSVTPNNESLINTLSNSDLYNNLANTSASQLIDVGVQTEVNINVEAGVQAVNTYVNTGMQTSARMWYETVRNWIKAILDTTPNSQAGL